MQTQPQPQPSQSQVYTSYSSQRTIVEVILKCQRCGIQTRELIGGYCSGCNFWAMSSGQR